MRIRNPQSAIRNRGGFTLVEVLAALVIFSVAIVAIIEGMGLALSFQTDLKMRQRAAMLASNVLEEIKYSNDLTGGDDQGQFDGVDAPYTWQTSITDSPVSGLMQVTATVSWGPPEHPQEYHITTLMYDAGTSDADTTNKEEGAGTGMDSGAGAGASGG